MLDWLLLPKKPLVLTFEAEATLLLEAFPLVDPCGREGRFW